MKKTNKPQNKWHLGSIQNCKNKNPQLRHHRAPGGNLIPQMPHWPFDLFVCLFFEIILTLTRLGCWVLCLRASPKLFGSGHNPESKHAGPLASLEFQSTPSTHGRGKIENPVAADTSFWNTLYSSRMVGRLRNQNLILHFTQQLLYATCWEVSEGETDPKSKHSWSIAIASFMYSVSWTESGIITHTVVWLIWE